MTGRRQLLQFRQPQRYQLGTLSSFNRNEGGVLPCTYAPFSYISIFVLATYSVINLLHYEHQYNQSHSPTVCYVGRNETNPLKRIRDNHIFGMRRVYYPISCWISAMCLYSVALSSNSVDF